jgi:hypothetical protein
MVPHFPGIHSRVVPHFPGVRCGVTRVPALPFFQKKLKEKTDPVIGREKK